MSETVNASSKAVKASVSAAAATPLVTDVVESALENPAAVASTVKWGVISLAVLAGAGAGAGVVLGVQKLYARKADKKLQAEVEEIVADKKTA